MIKPMPDDRPPVLDGKSLPDLIRADDARNQGASLLPGSRVMDLVTRREGIVKSCEVTNQGLKPAVPAAGVAPTTLFGSSPGQNLETYCVDLVNGAPVRRTKAQLLALPPLRAPLTKSFGTP